MTSSDIPKTILFKKKKQPSNRKLFGNICR